ncbi:MAG: CbiX/SirB N-terminal domain-containing protein, partial [Cryobacterium sp.]
VVIVPLLLSAGYHVRVDLAEAAAEASQPVRVTGALGPDLRLARVLADRLQQIDLAPTDRVVLAAAGSTDANAVADCHTVGDQLAAVLGRAVTVGFISAAAPRLTDAVLAARATTSGRVVVATYLLAPGYFAGLAADCGADAVSAPLLVDGEAPPRELVDVVIDLYASAARLEQSLSGLPWSFSSRP